MTSRMYQPNKICNDALFLQGALPGLRLGKGNLSIGGLNNPTIAQSGAPRLLPTPQLTLWRNYATCEPHLAKASAKGASVPRDSGLK